MLLVIHILFSALVFLLFAKLSLILVFFHLLGRLVGLVIIAAILTASFLKASLQHFFEAGFERFFDLALCLALKLDRICEAFKQIHGIAVSLNIVNVLATEHVELDTVPAQVFNQKRISVIKGHLKTKDTDEVQITGQFDQEFVVVLEFLALGHVFIDYS